MKIIHVTDDFSQGGWGMTTALAELTGQLERFGLKQVILAAGLDALDPPRGVEIRKLAVRRRLQPWRYPTGFEKAFDSLLGDRPMVHLHGVWMAPQYLAAKKSLQNGIPCSLSPHNMLGAWSLKNGMLKQIKKNIYWKLVSGRHFDKVNALHALTPLERDALHPFFPRKPIAVIPNGIDLYKVDQALAEASKESERRDEKFILILGRLHRVKGIELFIQAYAEIESRRRIPVIIAGPHDSEAYLQELKDLVKKSGLEKYVSFKGSLFGKEKWNLLRHAWIVCAPSYTEGMSMVALEAMSASTPIVTTYAAGIREVPEGGGILINPNTDELVRALSEVLAWSDEEKTSRGRAARQLVETRYSWDIVGPQYVDFYKNLQ